VYRKVKFTAKKNMSEYIRSIKRNIIILLIAVLLLVTGYIIMAAGESGTDAIFSFSRITLAPVMILSGYLTIILAILIKPSAK